MQYHFNQGCKAFAGLWKKKWCFVYDGVLSKSAAHKWLVGFLSGNSNVKDTPCLGRLIVEESRWNSPKNWGSTIHPMGLL